MIINKKLSQDRCFKYRKKILDISQKTTSIHLGGSFSCIEILDYVYNLKKKKKDIFILSKGHAGIAQYVVLNDIGIISNRLLKSYCTAKGILGVHPDYGNPGIKASTGSLGHGLGLAAGIAKGLKIKNSKSKIYILISDGELQEGSTWEAILMIANLNLNNIVCFIDNNRSQSFGITKNYHPNLYPIKKKINSFGWECMTVNGHNIVEIDKKVKKKDISKPLMIIANTVKGMGVSFIESDPKWHYVHITNELYNKMLKFLRRI